MKLPGRTVALIGAVCLTVGWLLASTLTPPVASVQVLPARQANASPPTPPTPAPQQVRLRLERASAVPTSRRNPFAFGERRRETTTFAPGEAVSPDLPLVPTPAVPVGPVFSLAGIGITGEVRTAILTDGQAVHVVKIGDRVGGYEIVDVTNHSVTLGEQSGLQYVLRLR